MLRPWPLNFPMRLYCRNCEIIRKFAPLRSAIQQDTIRREQRTPGENTAGMTLYACAVYISSGLASVAARAASAAARTRGCTVVDTFCDIDYSRSSVKLVGAAGPLLEGARAVAMEALRLVDLSLEPHPAPHPRQGAVDMVAFMPLSEDRCEAIEAELVSCDALAWQFGESLGSHGVPVLMYGSRARRSLLETRRCTSFFASVKQDSPRESRASIPCDFGPGPPVPQRMGLSIVGSMPYVTNFNIQVGGGASLADCRSAASRVRSEFGVQVMALPHAEGIYEIGCNLQAANGKDSPATSAVLQAVKDGLPSHARVSRSYVVGLTPADALSRATVGDERVRGESEE